MIVSNYKACTALEQQVSEQGAEKIWLPSTDITSALVAILKRTPELQT